MQSHFLLGEGALGNRPRKMDLVSMGMRGAAPKGTTFLSKGTEEDNSEGCVLLNKWRAD